jgi:argininosuccinate lyase
VTEPEDPAPKPDPYARLADLAPAADPADPDSPSASDTAPKADPYAELADLDADPAQKSDPYAGLADLDADPPPKADPNTEPSDPTSAPVPTPDPGAGSADLASDPVPKADPYAELADLAPPAPKPDPYAELADLAPAPEPGETPGPAPATTDATDPGVSAGAEGPEAQTLWHGRFTGGPADELMAFTVSLPFDRRLALDDLAGSRAHVAGLARGEVVTDLEATEIQVALDQVEQELTTGDFAFVPSDEDIHTAIERRVTELAGDAGAKLHTGRSRNDQVATALRLWCKRELAVVAERVGDLQRVLLDRARKAEGTYLPGYTHLQRAQPVLLSHHLLAHGWALARDVDRLRDTRRRLDVSPLGAGALAGSSLPLDPAFTAEQLGFAKPFDNSLDVVSDRDFVAEALFALSLLAVHLSRMGEEIVLWTSEEFGFARLDDAYATGSSMLPQKKNADIAELARGKAGRAIGNLTGLLATLKGLPLAYNRDLQEDKEPLFDSVDQVRLALGAMAGLYRTISFEPKAMQAAADDPAMAATDLAEWLVQQGMPFRRAHAVVGELVRRAIDQGQALEDLVALHPDLGPVPARLIGPGQAVRRRTTRGAAGPAAVAPQLEAFAAHLEAIVKPTPALPPAPAPEPQDEPPVESEDEAALESGSLLPLSGAGSTDVVTDPEPPSDEAPEAEATDPEPEDEPEPDEPEEPEEPEEPVAHEEPEEPDLKPGELPQIGPLVSAFSAAAASALAEEPEKPEKDPEKPVSGEFDLSEFGQFVASFDLDKPADDGKDES